MKRDIGLVGARRRPELSQTLRSADRGAFAPGRGGNLAREHIMEATIRIGELVDATRLMKIAQAVRRRADEEARTKDM